MIDKITIERIKLMHPYLRDKLNREYLEACDMLPPNYMLRITYTLRTFQEQDELYKQGRTKLFDEKGRRLGKVTNARGGESFHNFALAFDFCMLRDMDNNGKFETVDWDEVTQTKKIVKHFKKNGWEWGGDWAMFKDKPHFQYTFGYKCSQLYSKYMTKQFIEGTEYVKI